MTKGIEPARVGEATRGRAAREFCTFFFKQSQQVNRLVA